MLVNKIKNKLRQSKEKLEVGRSVSKYQLMQIMADLNYLGQQPTIAHDKLIKSAFAMFGEADYLSIQDVELLILGIDNVFDKSQPSRVIRDGRKLLDVNTRDGFLRFHKKL